MVKLIKLVSLEPDREACVQREVVKVHRKGIVVLPKGVREALGIEEGDPPGAEG